MTLEIALQAMQFNIPWLVGVIIANPINLFILAALFIFAFKGRGIKGFVKFVILFISVSALMEMFGFPFLATSIPIVYIGISVFLDSFPKESFVKRNLLKINLAMLFGAGFLLA